MRTALAEGLPLGQPRAGTLGPKFGAAKLGAMRRPCKRRRVVLLGPLTQLAPPADRLAGSATSI